MLGDPVNGIDPEGLEVQVGQSSGVYIGHEGSLILFRACAGSAKMEMWILCLILKLGILQIQGKH